MKQQNNLYIIAGCNGAGKTTASFTILPEMLHCKNFLNADEIARGLAPFQPEKADFEAGRIMLSKINELMELNQTFAMETTLSSKHYIHFIKRAKERGYFINLVFFWLESPELAIKRVQRRVTEGGHNIPDYLVVRRYFRGIRNLLRYYSHLADFWMVINNSKEPHSVIAEGNCNKIINIYEETIWNNLQQISYEE